MRVRRVDFVMAILCLSAAALNVRASERRFTYVYEATTLPKGSWEFEQWVT